MLMIYQPCDRWREMPVYEYECKECKKVLEVQQRMTDAPLSNCPECNAPVKKLMSMSSFQLKGGGWYSDGYSSVSKSADNESSKPASPATPAAPPCQTGAGCPATAATS
jgi:putative FmdB family regulatory protein